MWASTPLARWWPRRASAATPPATAEPAPTMAGDAAAPAVAPTLPLEETLAQAGVARRSGDQAGVCLPVTGPGKGQFVCQT